MRSNKIVRPNLILITVECWRGDHFGSLTPRLSQLGAESTVFSDAQASGGWTLASMTALMTSAYASMHGGCRIALRTPERKPLAEYLVEHGYWTAGFTTNPTCGGSAGFHRGFCEFHDVAAKPPALPEEAYAHRQDWQRLAEMGIPPSAIETIAGAPQLTDLGLNWIQAREPDEPWFLWLHYTDSHWPYLTDPSSQQELCELWSDRHLFKTEIYSSKGKFAVSEETKARWLNRYREALGITDREIGRLLDAVRARPDWGRTIVAAAGDHGEEFFEHGTWQHQWNPLYREGIHVPLIMRVPGSGPRNVTQPVTHLDIAPTFLEYAGIKRPQSMMGLDLGPSIAGQPLPARPVLTEMMAFPERIVLSTGHSGRRLEVHLRFRRPASLRLFRVSADPCERENLRDRYPEIFRHFEEMRFRHVTRGLIRLLERQSAAENYENQDELVKEQLAALGYL